MSDVGVLGALGYCFGFLPAIHANINGFEKAMIYV
jgi:hypothetical protein